MKRRGIPAKTGQDGEQRVNNVGSRATTSLFGMTAEHSGDI